MWKNVHVAIRPPLTQKLPLSSITESRGSSFFPSLSLVGDSRRKISSPVAEASVTCAVSDEAESSAQVGYGEDCSLGTSWREFDPLLRYFVTAQLLLVDVGCQKRAKLAESAPCLRLLYAFDDLNIVIFDRLEWLVWERSLVARILHLDIARLCSDMLYRIVNRFI